MSKGKCGIYKINCRANDKDYVGSSKQIYLRWTRHRQELRRGKSNCRILQNAWLKHGEDAFVFSILEECLPDELEAREQFYIDTLKPALNSLTDVKRRYGAEQRARITAAHRARAALITHCPHGHLYDDKNSYISKRNGCRICRTCNKERVANIYANETPEQHAARLERGKKYHEENYDERTTKQRAYMAAHKEEKREYDKAYRVIKNQRRRKSSYTSEQWAEILAEKRAWHQEWVARMSPERLKSEQDRALAASRRCRSKRAEKKA
jgi:group I intron endonuclease